MILLLPALCRTARQWSLGWLLFFFFLLAIPFTSKSNGGPFGRFQLTISILGLFDLAVRERETEAEKNKKQKTELEHKSRKE
jgi:hypothetical protein